MLLKILYNYLKYTFKMNNLQHRNLSSFIHLEQTHIANPNEASGLRKRVHPKSKGFPSYGREETKAEYVNLWLAKLKLSMSDEISLADTDIEEEALSK